DVDLKDGPRADSHRSGEVVQVPGEVVEHDPPAGGGGFHVQPGPGAGDPPGELRAAAGAALEEELAGTRAVVGDGAGEVDGRVVDRVVHAPDRRPVILHIDVVRQGDAGGPGGEQGGVDVGRDAGEPE